MTAFSPRVNTVLETLSPAQRETIVKLATTVTINCIVDNANGSVKVYTSRPNGAVAMVKDKKVWWLNANGKATVIGYKW